jgi:hypothetical protein
LVLLSITPLLVRRTKINMFRKSYSQFLVAVLCGGCAALILAARYYVDLALGLTMDGREIFLILGAALAGPWAAVLMNIFMAIGIVIGYPEITAPGMAVDVISHLTGTILFAVLYRKVIYERVKKPLRTLSWVVLVPFYYWVLLAPVASILYYVVDLTPTPLFVMTLPIWPEVIVTTILTTLVMTALPAKWRKPLWGSPDTPNTARSVTGMS